MTIKPTNAIERAIAAVDPPTQAELARQIHIDYQHVHRWLKRGWAPPKHALKIEQATGVPLADLIGDVGKKRKRT